AQFGGGEIADAGRDVGVRAGEVGAHEIHARISGRWRKAHPNRRAGMHADALAERRRPDRVLPGSLCELAHAVRPSSGPPTRPLRCLRCRSATKQEVLRFMTLLGFEIRPQAATDEVLAPSYALRLRSAPRGACRARVRRSAKDASFIV